VRPIRGNFDPPSLSNKVERAAPDILNIHWFRFR
jgi:hypothetical protein